MPFTAVSTATLAHDNYPPFAPEPIEGDSFDRIIFTGDSDMDDSLIATGLAPLSDFLASRGSHHTSPSVNDSPSPLMSDDEQSGAYFNFFLTELEKCFPYVKLFPWTAATLFSSSNHNPALRQSVLAVAALLANRDAQGQAEALGHLQNALYLIGDKLSKAGVDEGLAISSFLLSHFSIMLGDHVTAKKHLRGMLVVLDKLNPSRESNRIVVPNPSTNTELTILIWRMAIRIDFICSVTSGQRPILPKFCLHGLHD